VRAQQRELAVRFRRCLRQGLGARLLVLSSGCELLQCFARLAKVKLAAPECPIAAAAHSSIIYGKKAQATLADGKKM
jgi:hypothetical protein